MASFIVWIRFILSHGWGFIAYRGSEVFMLGFCPKGNDGILYSTECYPIFYTSHSMNSHCSYDLPLAM